MRSWHWRVRALLIGGVLCAIGLPVASAGAIVPTSQITTPAGTTYLFADDSVEEGGTITIAGTAQGTTEVEVRCYYGATPGEDHSLGPAVPVTGEKFSLVAPRVNLGTSRCQLRAVPKGFSEALPPEAPSAFEGPIVVPSTFEQQTAANFTASSSSLAGSFFFESAGKFSLEGALYSAVLHELVFSLFGEVDLTAFDDKYAPKTRSALQVDGMNAYVPNAAAEVQGEIENEHGKTVELPGLPSLTVPVPSFNEASHALVIHERDPAARCAPGNAFPPTFASCTSLQATGVTLERTWETSGEDHVAWLTETWRSTDGAAHSVNARYYTEMQGISKEAVYMFPGSSAFAPTSKGELVSLPTGPGAILYKTDSKTPEAGDGSNPQAALVYDSAPNEPLTVTRASGEGSPNVYETPYQLTIPAGGSRTLRMAFVQAFGLPEVSSLAAAAIASYYPKVAITSPAGGTTVAAASVTVAGTASDTGALASLAVNGAAVAVAPDGAWSTVLALKPGANTITALASDQAGLTSSSAITVSYTPPTPLARATASQLGVASGAGAQVTLSLACHGAKGTSCRIKATLTTVEKTRGGKLIGVSAKLRTRSKTLTIATVTVVIPAGGQARITLRLNATGRKLLARFGRLPVHLTAVLEGEGTRHAIVTQNLTIKPKPRKPRKHRH